MMKGNPVKQKANIKKMDKTRNTISEYNSKMSKTKELKIKKVTKGEGTKVSKETNKSTNTIEIINKNKDKYPIKNISKDQLERATEFVEKCGNCIKEKTSPEYYKSLLLSYLDLIIKCYEDDTFPLDATKIITLPIFSDICHKAAEVLASEPTLLILNNETPSETFLVLSDIHGCFDVIIHNFYYYHCLPKKRIIILGDYVDKGADDAFICLFLFLCKIVWSDKIYLLKGNHEIRDMNRQKDFPDNCEFLLGDKSTFYLFNFVFERMPLAAIWNEKVYLAHGGISQWITCRNDITNIKRPLKLNRSLKSRLLITDILWSDPYRKSYKTKDDFSKYFGVSKRGCGFVYSKEGLEVIMKCLNVSMVIRGHQTSREGFVEEYKNICYTVHSKPRCKSNSFGSSCLLTLDNNGNVIVKPLRYKLTIDKNGMLNALNKLKILWKKSKISEFNFQPVCLYCCDKSNYLNELGCSERILITHSQLTIWLVSSKIQTLIEMEFGKKVEKKWKNPEKLLTRLPLYLDFCIWSKIGQSVRVSSIIEKKEKDLMFLLFKKIDKMNEKNILVADPNLTVDVLKFLCLNQIEGKKRKNFENTSDEEFKSSSSGGSSSENDASEEEDEL
ncbi:Serine/threonine-protein phosphatase 5 [Strongyloides ratti]|uniref:Serine/threonine-protein phosphatase n=1 Tax=Strongyloides ratti TaxID=34506 RepID=A0A090LBH8_STRRB|nr:Serine/threonine-protein phosphatase 5 [Strongyloides ratti]CEF64875.1 Serine/threonine-protein phosphatase 5 [Strongyloides ratti]